MSRRAYRAAPVVVAAAALALAAALLGPRLLADAGDRSGAVLPGEQAVSVAASLVPSVHLFGDPVEARVQVAVDRRRIDPATVRVEWDLAPYEEVGPRRVERRDVGHVAHLAHVVTVRCLALECVPPRLASDAGEMEGGRGERHAFTFEPVRVTYSGEVDPRQVRFPPLEVVSRINARQWQQDVEAWQQSFWTGVASMPFRDDLTPVPPSWSAEPRLVAALALAGAALLLLVPLAQAAGWARARRRTPAERWALLPPRERARLVAAWAAGRDDPGERRRALELAATELGAGGDELLAARAREIAWAGGAPPPDAADDLARTLSGRGNGSGA